MTQFSILAMILGAVILMVLPVPRSRLARNSSKGLGAVVFSVGLLGLVYSLVAPAA